MVHLVTPLLDRGEVYDQTNVVINSKDTYENLEQRVKSYEKGSVVCVLQNEVSKFNTNLLESEKNNKKEYVGKVRTVSDIDMDTY